jgi:hypothetical protein
MAKLFKSAGGAASSTKWETPFTGLRYYFLNPVAHNYGICYHYTGQYNRAKYRKTSIDAQ